MAGGGNNIRNTYRLNEFVTVHGISLFSALPV